MHHFRTHYSATLGRPFEGEVCAQGFTDCASTEMGGSTVFVGFKLTGSLTCSFLRHRNRN